MWVRDPVIFVIGSMQADGTKTELPVPFSSKINRFCRGTDVHRKNGTRTWSFCGRGWETVLPAQIFRRTEQKFFQWREIEHHTVKTGLNTSRFSLSGNHGSEPAHAPVRREANTGTLPMHHLRDLLVTTFLSLPRRRQGEASIGTILCLPPDVLPQASFKHSGNLNLSFGVHHQQRGGGGVERARGDRVLAPQIVPSLQMGDARLSHGSGPHVHVSAVKTVIKQGARGGARTPMSLCAKRRIALLLQDRAQIQVLVSPRKTPKETHVSPPLLCTRGQWTGGGVGPPMVAKVRPPFRTMHRCDGKGREGGAGIFLFYLFLFLFLFLLVSFRPRMQPHELSFRHPSFCQRIDVDLASSPFFVKSIGILRTTAEGLVTCKPALRGTGGKTG
mmetsp:Transcript_43046/g.111448  ORF Transcript_43046/g.111448 Transcript_43046/m.111448 type:complete len:388 (+) Transcript_43046:399-1562(+)